MSLPGPLGLQYEIGKTRKKKKKTEEEGAEEEEDDDDDGKDERGKDMKEEKRG